MIDDEKDLPADEETLPPEEATPEEAPGEDATVDEEGSPTDEDEAEDAEPDADEEDEDEPEAEEPAAKPKRERTPRAPIGPTVVAGRAVLVLIALNIAGVAVALPGIQADVDASFRDIVWVQVAFLLGLAVLFPLAEVTIGALGRRPAIVLGAVVVAAGTALCVVASTPDPIIAGRALQGAGSALLLAVLATRNNAFVVMLAFGPLIGGALVHALDWQWVFWIQFALIVAIIILGVRADAEEPRRVPLDPFGALAYAAGLVAVVLALIQLDDWSWQVVTGLGVAGVLALASLVPLDRRTNTPILDFTPFRDRTFLTTAIAYAVLVGAFWAALMLEAQNLQDVFDHNALEAGAILLPLTLPLLVAGALRDRVEERSLMIGALVVGVGGLALLGLVGSSDDDVRLIPGLLLLGLGLMGAAAALPALAIAKLPEIRTTARTAAAGRRSHSSHRTGRSTAEREKSRRPQKPQHPPRKGEHPKRRRPGAAEAAAAKKRREEREKAARKGGAEPEKTPPKAEEKPPPKQAEKKMPRAEKEPEAQPAPVETRSEAGALEWSRLAGGVIVLSAISSLFLWLYENRKSEVTPSASEGGPGPRTLLDGLLAGSPDVAQRLTEFSAAVKVGVEIALRDALAYASGRAMFLGAALLLAAILLSWWAGPPSPSPDPDSDDPRHERFPL